MEACSVNERPTIVYILGEEKQNATHTTTRSLDDCRIKKGEETKVGGCDGIIERIPAPPHLRFAHTKLISCVPMGVTCDGVTGWLNWYSVGLKIQRTTVRIPSEKKKVSFSESKMLSSFAVSVPNSRVHTHAQEYSRTHVKDRVVHVRV